MSYFIVPAVSYQTQQKLNSSKGRRKKTHKGKHSKHGKETKSESASLKSSSTDSTNVSSTNKRTQEVKSEDGLSMGAGNSSSPSVDSKEYSELSSSIASKYTKAADNPSGFQPPRTIEEDEAQEKDSAGDTPSSTRKSSTWSNYSMGSSISAGSSYRRNSSMTSSHTHNSQGHKHRFGRKFSSSFLGMEKNPSDKTNNEKPSSVSEASEMSELSAVNESSEAVPVEVVPDTQEARRTIKIDPFYPVTDLSVLNSQTLMKKYLFSPVFQIFRYNNYLDILSSHHKNDPINFAKVRNHSLTRFLIRHKDANYGTEDLDASKLDMRYYESWLAYELLLSRTFLRRMIRSSEDFVESGSVFDVPEELVQVNFTNYVRYLLNLPERTSENFNDFEYDNHLETHYRYKETFKKITQGIFNIKKERGEEPVKESKSGYVNILLQAVTKVSYEFILLEKYHIQILSKISNNSLISMENTKKLFDIYKQNLEEDNKESVKVLVYNTWFSAQYSWYLAVAMPFIRIYEANINSEVPKFISDYNSYIEHEKTVPKTFIQEHDEDLYDNFFNQLQLNDFEHYQAKSFENLANLHRSLDQKFLKLNTNAKFNNQPMNFEYYTQSLCTVPNDTFNLIQTRDIALQTKADNLKTVLREFHRVLKKGGSLETTSSISCPRILKNWFDKYSSSIYGWILNKNYFSSTTTLPDNIVIMLDYLNEIFGEGNVKFNISTLAAGDISGFISKHCALQFYESSGHLSEFFSIVEEFKNTNSGSEDNVCVFHIHATK